MLKKRIYSIGCLLLLCLLIAGPAMGNEWRIDFQGDANSGGTYGQTAPVDMTEPDAVWNIFEVPALDAAYPGPVTYAEAPIPLALLDIEGKDFGVVFTDLSDAWGWAGDAGQESQPMDGDYLLVLNTFGVDCDPSNWEITGLAPGSECTLTFYNAAHGNAGRACGFLANGVSAYVTGAAGSTVDTITVTVDETGKISGTVDSANSAEGNWSGLVIVGTPAPREQAIEPLPEAGQTDVLFDTDLEWTAGRFAATHDIYFGMIQEDVNNADRSSPLGVLVSEGQTDSTFDPGPLEFGQTYYWRVDEVNGAPDNTIFKGRVWSFTVELLARTIESVIATSNATPTPGQGPERLVDGSGLDNGQHSTNADDMWTGTPNADEPTYLQFEFDRVYKLHEMLVWNYNIQFELFLGYGLKEVTLEYSQDGTEWTVLGGAELAQATGDSTYTANTTVPLQGVAAKYLRVTINSNFSGSNSVYGLSEVRFSYIPVQPTQPVPADGDVDVALDTALTWRHGREASSHEVYFGTDPNTLTLVDTTTESLYNAALDLGTTHYWQIVEVNEAEPISTWAGDVWSFSTQEYIQIDGFETYTDDIEAGNAIWQSWVDGIDDTSNGGGVVGYGQSPFAEQTTVHSGSQSMPFFFDNASASAISEADRTLTPAQDWTTNGIKSLSLWFYGASGNAGTLYVKINNTKVVYNGDASDISIPMWQPWNIDLTTVGGDLSNVTTLSLGVEGAGSGMVFIDDIRLYGKVPRYVTPVQPDVTNLVAYYALDGNANDASGNGYNGTEEGDLLYFAGLTGQAASFNGADTAIDCGDVPVMPDGTITVAFWVNPRDISVNWAGCVAKWTMDNSQRTFWIGQHSTDGWLRFGLYPGGPTAETPLDTGRSILVNDEWTHVVCTYDGDTQRIYGQGVEVASASRDGAVVVDRGGNLRLGAITTANRFDGLLDDVRIYGRTLSAEEAASLAGKTAPVNVEF